MDAGDNPPPAGPDIDSDWVHVLTVHKAKGLEFGTVFMVGLVSERFPRRKRKDPIEVPEGLVRDIVPTGDFHLEEERRLFYVGMTRAMDELYLTSASDYGGVRAKKVSRFVLEALDTPRAATTIKAAPKEAIERFAPVRKATHGLEPIAGDTVLRLSHYQIDDYLTCPLKFKYVHVLKVPLLPHHAVMYGKAVHDAISIYFRRKTEGVRITEEELIDAFRGSWRSEGFVSREHETRRWEAGAAALKGFLAREGANGIMPAAVEKDFSVELGTSVLRGRWDMVEERQDGPYVIDFKTSEMTDKKKADKRAKGSVQLKLYALAYEKNFGRPPAGCELHFVESGLVGGASFDQPEMEKTLGIIDEVASGIRERDFTAKPDYLNCGWCAFNNICPEK
ncbi:MAG: PD-(D/E)XK nuclease family protein, partial [Thermodesulfobacteriota bacterium]